MGVSGGGGSNGGSGERTAIVQSEKEQLQELDRRMTLYDSLFGEMEKEWIQDSLGVLNTDRLTTHTDALDTMFEREKVLQSEMEADKATLMSYAGLKEEDFKIPESIASADAQPGKAGSRFYSADLDAKEFYNWTWQVPVSFYRDVGAMVGLGSSANKKAKAKAKKIKKRVAAAKARYEKNANELIELQQNRADTAKALQEEFETQRRNSKLEKTEQDRERASGTVAAAFKTTAEAQRVRDERYGIQAGNDPVASEENSRELALMKAAAEAGARNKAKEDVDALADAKLGAIAGADLTDRAAGQQLNNLQTSFLSTAAGYKDQAARAGRLKDAATMQIIQGIGSMGGAIAGTAYGVSNRTPTATQDAQQTVFNPNWNPPPATVEYAGAPGAVG